MILHGKTKWAIAFLLAIPMADILKFIQTYVYSDIDYLRFLIILMLLDAFMGLLIGYKTHKISIAKFFNDSLIKLSLYATALITIHVLGSFTINGIHPSVIDFTDSVLMSALMLKEVVSVFLNINTIRPGFIPPFILKRLQGFNSDTGEAIEDPKQLNDHTTEKAS